jgi:hypothetical protein
MRGAPQQIDPACQNTLAACRLIVKIKSAFIFNGIFESQKNVFSGQFFAKNGQFQPPGFAVNHRPVNHGIIGLTAWGVPVGNHRRCRREIRRKSRQPLPSLRAAQPSAGGRGSWGARAPDAPQRRQRFHLGRVSRLRQRMVAGEERKRLALDYRPLAMLLPPGAWLPS